MNIKYLIALLRPKQWIKNLILFAALVFSRNLFDFGLFLKTFCGFLTFCLFSSSVYIINDIADREKDRLHPQKKLRPLASGKLSLSAAAGLLAVILSAAIFFSYMLKPAFMVMGLLYLVLMLAYTFFLKNIVILDVLTISIGFVIRGVTGSILINVYFSNWLLLCTILLALFLALQKRKAELLNVTSGESGSRKTLTYYTPDFINEMLNVVTSCTLMSYCLYTLSYDHTELMTTIPVVLYGIFRYQYLSGKGLTEAPEHVLLRDKPLLVTVLIWVVMCVFILYAGIF